VDRVAPTFAELGLPEDRGFVSMDLGGTHPPGASLEFTIGVYDGVAPVRRRFAWALVGDGGEIARAEAGIGALSARDPLHLVVRVPDQAPAGYRLTLRIDDRVLEWPVSVPEQWIEGRVVCEPARVRRGDRMTVTLHNDGPGELSFGLPYAIERSSGEEWVEVDPFDGDEQYAWAAIGFGLASGGAHEFKIDVPRRTEPGLHRVVKPVSSDTVDACLTGEFTVET